MEYKTAEGGKVSLLEMQVPQVKGDLTVEEIFTELQKTHETFLSPSITSATQIKRLLGMLVSNIRAKDEGVDSIQVSDLQAGLAERKQQIQEQLTKVGADEEEESDDSADGDLDFHDNLNEQLGHTNETDIVKMPDRFTDNDEETAVVANEHRYYDDDKDFEDDDDFEQDEDDMDTQNINSLNSANNTTKIPPAEADDCLEEIEEIDDDIAAEDDDSDDFEFDPVPDLGDDDGRFH